MSRLHRAFMVAIYSLITFHFVHAGALALMLYVLALERGEPGGIVAAGAAGFFFYVAIHAVRALKRALGTPTL